MVGCSGYWAVIFFQQLASIGNNLTIQIVAGQYVRVRLQSCFSFCGTAKKDCALACTGRIKPPAANSSHLRACTSACPPVCERLRPFALHAHGRLAFRDVPPMQMWTWKH